MFPLSEKNNYISGGYLHRTRAMAIPDWDVSPLFASVRVIPRLYSRVLVTLWDFSESFLRKYLVEGLITPMPVLSDKANTNPAYEAVVMEPGNSRPNNPCRGLDGGIRGAFDRQIKRCAGKQRFPGVAADQCPARADIVGFPGQDAQGAFDRDRVPDIKSFAFASLVTRRMACYHGTHPIKA
jgi:hypothetical protein